MNSEKSNQDVTVITVTRHRPKILQRAISSIQKQSYSLGNIVHLILVDGCFETWAFMNSVSPLPRTYFHLCERTPEDKSGPGRLAKLRNQGVGLSNSQWVCFLDDDNEYMPDHIETLVKCALQSNCRAVHSHLQLLTKNGNLYLETRLPWSQDPIEGQLEYKKLRDRGVFQEGSNIVRDRVDPLDVDDPVRTVDTGEWLFERTLLLEYPFPEEYSDEDWVSMTTEDDKLMQLLVENRIKIACTGKPTLKYYLGGYSNTFQLD